MEGQQEIGGAQALLSLGSKSKSDDEQDTKRTEDEVLRNASNEEEIVNDSDDNNVNEQHDASEADLSKTSNDQLNDAVEAAVMRYVGGSLDSADNHSNEQKRSRRRLNHEDLISNINEFNQWTGFLEEEMASSQQEDFQAFENSQHQAGSHILENTKSPEKKKRRKNNNLSHTHNEIDPELTGLDSNSEHDQLVQAAMIDARELAKHLGNSTPHDSDSYVNSSLQGLTQQQAQQVIAAANAAASQNSANHRHDLITPINQLAQAAASTLTGTKDKSDNKLKKGKMGEVLFHSGKQGDHLPQHDPRENKMTYLTSLESLIEDASIQACNWYNSIPHTGNNGPRIFSQEEISAVDHFIAGYCHLNKLSRDDICNRIWSNERKKDNFWESLTRILPYRSRASVYKHVRRQYHVFEVRAKWSKADDDLLRKLASTKEGNWKDIGETMCRMPEDCRDRWRNYVKCGENRVLNKWSEEEERKLKDIVSEMMSSSTNIKFRAPVINWTIVSEKMNGARSRIQCRYKWNKLVRRASAERAAYMNQDTKIWLLQKLQRINFPTFESIDWNYMSHLYNDDMKNPEVSQKKENNNEIWGATDFKVCFEKMKSEIKDHKRLELTEIVDRLINDLYIRSGQIPDHHSSNTTAVHHRQQNTIPLNSTADDIQFSSDRSQHMANVQSSVHDEDDATSIANAAVAAVAVGVHDDHSSEDYTIWR